MISCRVGGEGEEVLSKTSLIPKETPLEIKWTIVFNEREHCSELLQKNNNAVSIAIFMQISIQEKRKHNKDPEGGII